MGISVRDLRVAFRGPRGKESIVLDVPEFSVPRGKQVCIAGSSGSGKTTFLHTLAGIVVPNAGQIFYDDVELTQLSEVNRDRFRAEHVGYVFQTFNLLQGLTVLENLLLAQHFAGQRSRDAKAHAEALVERVGLAHRRDARPRTLSVGEQQRVAIARAVVNHPWVVLADEPMANLDEDMGDEVLALLREAVASEGSILVLVTHERRVQEQFDDVRPMKEISR